MSAAHKLARQTFIVERHLDFFTEGGLRSQIGYDRSDWPAVLLKELVDNAMDGCEATDVAPEIKISLEDNALTVTDNGPGLPASTIADSLDYNVRVSDKAAYMSPTRGQLGNALKCVWALPYVASDDAQRGVTDVTAQGIHHHIVISGSSRAPDIEHTEKPSHVKNGTSVKVRWSGLACLANEAETFDFYTLVKRFACINPHVTFQFQRPNRKLVIIPATAKNWKKWRTSDPTSAYWYDDDAFANLIASYVKVDQSDMTVGKFIGEFDGLSGSQYRKDVTDKVKVTGKTLADLNAKEIVRLLAKMKATTREVQPSRLGVIGAEHFRRTLVALGISKGSFRYKKKLGSYDGLPFVLEVAFGAKQDTDLQRDLLMGVNFSPTIKKILNYSWEREIDRADIHDDDPVILAMHLVTPRPQFTTLGKGEISEDSFAVKLAMQTLLPYVTKNYTAIKRRGQRNNERRVSQERLAELGATRTEKRSEKEEIKAATWRVLPEAYAKASGGVLALARQLMYACRPLVLAITGGKIWSAANYFTQTLLPDYIKSHPEETKDWDVVYDDRGHFKEPHTDVNFGLGTVSVRDYLKSWSDTHGPLNRYRHALLIEKEGFDSLLERANLAERYDIACFSCKGISNIAARQLVAALTAADVKTFVAHDLDFSGFNIYYTLGHDTTRFEFADVPNVVDIGLRLTDVQEMDLQSERYHLKNEKDPKIKLREYGATDAELEFMIGDYHGKTNDRKGYWDATRVELNAMTSPQMISWLERKLVEHGVTKFVPDDEVLEPIWREGVKVIASEEFSAGPAGNYVRDAEAQLVAVKAQLQSDFEAQYEPPRTPHDLRDQVAEHLESNRAKPWEEGVKAVVEGKFRSDERR